MRPQVRMLTDAWNPPLSFAGMPDTASRRENTLDAAARCAAHGPDSVFTIVLLMVLAAGHEYVGYIGENLSTSILLRAKLTTDLKTIKCAGLLIGREIQCSREKTCNQP